MRVAYLCSEYPAVSHTFILREVEALRRRGLAVDTFTVRRTSPASLLSPADRDAHASTFAILPPGRLRLLRVHLRLAARAPATYLAVLLAALRLAPAGARGVLWQFFYFVEAVILFEELERRGIRHIHVHFANVSADVALLAVRLGSALDTDDPWTWSFTMHGPTEFADVRHYRLAAKLRDADFVVCISEYARSQLLGLSEPASWSKLVVVHVGLPIERFTVVDDTPPPGDEPEILCVGRLVPEKGQAVLIEALALLTAKGTRVRLRLAGEGPSRGELEALAARLGVGDSIRFDGAVGQDVLRDLYEGASVFCLPSFAEGVPVVLMEAMAMRLPVVSTPITGIPELIEDGLSGTLVAPGRADLLAVALERILADDSLRERMGACGREKVLAEFDAEVSAARLQELFLRRPVRR